MFLFDSAVQTKLVEASNDRDLRVQRKKPCEHRTAAAA